MRAIARPSPTSWTAGSRDAAESRLSRRDYAAHSAGRYTVGSPDRRCRRCQSDAMSAETPAPTIKFTDLALSEPLLRALNDVGYESPSPIQAATIPPLLAGRDVLGQAQTGTGKTAAFALPILAQIDPKQFKPQALVLAPTRELAIQVAEAFQQVRRAPARLPRAADLRRPELLPAAAGAQARRARRRRHPRPRDRPPRPRHARPVRAALPGARRSRRDAAHGLHRRRRERAQEDPGDAPGRAVLGDDAVADPAHRPDLPEGAGRDRDQVDHDHRRQHPPALLVGQRRAQARRADPHPRGRTASRR